MFLKWTSIIIGLVLVALGVLPILNQFGVVAFSFSLPLSILTYVLGGTGILLIIDSFLEDFMNPMAMVSLMVGILILLFGLLMTLSSFGVLPFEVPAIGMMIYNVLFITEGLVMMIGAAMYISGY